MCYVLCSALGINRKGDIPCYGLNVCVLPKFLCWCPNSLCDGIWRCSLWEVIRFRWGHDGGAQVVRFSLVQPLSHVWLFVTPWTAAHQASLTITNSRSLLKLMSIKSVMPSDHFILCCPLLLLPSVFPRIRVFSDESVLCIRWPKYWSFSFSISSSNEHSGLISFRMD